MRGAEFKERALDEGIRYGEDRMVFLREFAQNARDAGARRIGVTTKTKDNTFVLTFLDNGTGMDLEHAYQYLFTLYASSKENEDLSAGRFGVGFWSVLLFEPSQIEIESRTRDDSSWKMVLDADLKEPKSELCTLKSKGTRITVARPQKGSDEGKQLTREVERALVHYCRYLRQNTRSALPLAISLNGKSINQPFDLKGPCWMTFEDGSVEGAVGLGDTPNIDLFARGLLAWSGTLLEELRYGAPLTKPPKHSVGLAPCYLLNGNDLNVTLNRRAVIDDNALHKVRRVAKKRMRELLRRYLDMVSPRPPGQKIVDFLKGAAEDIKFSNGLPKLLSLGAVIVVVALVFLAGAHWLWPEQEEGSQGDAPVFPVRAPRPAIRQTPLSKPIPFFGPSIDPLSDTDRVPLTYNPPVSQMFRMAAYEQLHAGRGIVGDSPVIVEPAQNYVCNEGCFDVAVEIDKGPLLVPVPTGHLVEPKSVFINGKPIEALYLSEKREPVIKQPDVVKGRLIYRTGPAAATLDPLHRERLLQVPGLMRFKKETQTVIMGTADEKTKTKKVTRLRKFVEKRLLYDASLVAQKAYARFLSRRSKAGWTDFVFAYGRGDCDVKNTVLVALLRKVGIPARLAMGVTGEEGQAVVGMHAWVEYFDGNWRIADATGGRQTAPVTSPAPLPQDGPTKAANEPPRPALLTDAAHLRPIGQRQHTPSDSGRPWIRTVSLVAAGVALFSVFVVLLFLSVGRKKRRLFVPEHGKRGRQVARDIVSNALAHPETWLKIGGVTYRRLLPVHGTGKDMSLDEALSRGRSATLFFSNGESDLARQAVKAGTRILDASDPVFGTLILSLPGIIDLDEIDRLGPLPPRDLPEELTHVSGHILQINQILRRSGLPDNLVIPSSGPDHALSRDVDLEGLILPRRSDWRPTFIAVRARSETLLKWAKLGLDQPNLAAFLTLERLLQESDLLRPYQKRIRTTAARMVFKVAQ